MRWASIRYAPASRYIPSDANEATVHLKDGKSFKVIAHNNSRDNKYVRSIVLNGNKLETPFFTHQDIVDGGTLELTMGSEPLK